MTLKFGHALATLARSAFLVALLAVSCAAFGQNGSIELTAFPGVTVADGRSTITVTAQVRDSAGSLVSDGTAVLFETTLGKFRETLVTTQNGLARAVLEASGIPGAASVRASVTKFNSVAALEVVFVADRSLLSSANDYIEVVGQRDMAYSLEHKILEASSENRGVHLRYRDIVIDADDIQLTVPNYEVRAKNAKLTMGDKSWELKELYMRLNQRKGVGTAVYEQESYRFAWTWYLAVPTRQLREQLGTVEISPAGVTPSEFALVPGQVEFIDISEALTIIEAKKAIAYPARQVDFHRANVIVGTQSVMKVPLFRASTQPQSPIITEQFVNISNNDLAVNYPYYLDLRPGQTSLLRFRYGRNYGAGLGASGGMYLDYEFNWNQGSTMDGGLSVRGLARNDWGLSLRQFWRPSNSTSFSAQVDFPAHKSMFANANLSQDLGGYSANLNASHGQNIDGTRFRSNQYSMIVEKDPIRMGPARLFVGLQASQTDFDSPTSSTTSKRAGLRARFIGDTMRLGPGRALNLSYTLGHFSGSNVTDPLTHHATLALTTSFGNGLFIQTNYDYVVDGITDLALGRHRLSTDAYFFSGPWSLRGFVTKSIDVQRLNASASLNFKASSLWRVNYGYYLDQYLGDSFLDQTLIVAYRIGFREVGLSYSARRNRLGIEILGTTFN